MRKYRGIQVALGSWILFFCAGLLAYWPALRGGPLWDDDHHITSAALQSIHGLWRIWFEPGATQQYYPLLHSAFWMEHRLWGGSVLGYHLVTLALHALAACLVVTIVRRLAIPGAWLAGLIFLLHPMQVEAVAWISEQKTTLSAVLYLASGLAYLKFDESRRRVSYIAATALFVLALLAKTVTATLPAALLLILWWKRGRLEFRRDAVPLSPWLLIGAAAGLLTASVERSSIGAQGTDFAFSLLDRTLIAGRVLCFYTAKLLWPANLMFTYPRWHVDAGQSWQYLFPAAAIVAAIVLVWMARRRRGPLAACLYFAGTLFPVLGFLNVYPFLFSFEADHFVYLAALGLFVPTAGVITATALRFSPGCSRTGIATGILLAAILGVLTFRQAGIYRDSETLYRATLARNPASWMAHNNLCALLMPKAGHLAEATAECQAAIALRPQFAEAHNNLGSALAQTGGRMPDAIAEFRAALRIKPQFADAHFNLANALAQGPVTAAEAVAEYRMAIAIRPDYIAARLNLAVVLLRMGRVQDAIAEDRTVISIDPDLAEAHTNLGSALAQIPGRAPDAMAEFRAAVALDPHSSKAHDNLGNMLADMPGQLMAAIAEYEAAVRANPDFGDAHFNLGVALARAGRIPEAVAEFQQAVRCDPQSAKVQYNLAVTLAKSGRLAEAMPHFDAALRLRPDPELQRMVDRLRVTGR
ncbi:MAG TPA: tetratricopeptide repeat protein [Verrucomicrobiae bacterium]|nr:tetratricopeptide repeat protein [Verrucomicrobiae bacterium]